ncbi:hypothetical protein ACSBR2_039360 [Camellia fascicularis]
MMVGFNDEALTVKEQLAGGKKQLHIILIVGMPELVPKKREMLLNILHSVNLLTNEVTNMSNEMLGEKLYKHFKGKRYLIVIDDIWDIGAWVDLKMYLPNDNLGKGSWELFQWKVFQKESFPSKLIEIRKEIMKKCKGLPLAIVVIAGLLAKNKKTEECWKQVCESVSSYIVSDLNQYLDTLVLSYNHLPRLLKPCFLYLGAFPEELEISV